MIKHALHPVFALAALAVLVRVGYMLVFGGLDDRLYDSMSDQLIYLDIGKNLASGNGFVVSNDTWVASPGTPTSIVPPLYPLVVGLMFKVFGYSLIPLRLLNVALGAGLVVLVYLIGKQLYGQRTGLMAAALTACYPPLVMYARPLMSESLFYPLVAGLICSACSIIARPRQRWLYVSFGVISGLAALTRSEGALLTALLLTFLLVVLIRRGQSYTLPYLALAVALTGAILLPYAAYNAAVHGRFSPTPNARWKFWDHTWWAATRHDPAWSNVVLPERVVVPNWDTVSEAERDGYLWDRAVDWVKANPRTFLIQRIKRLYWSYPLVPIEEMPPPFGNRTDPPVPPDGASFSPTSLDDVVRYVTVPEKLRVWSFRIVALLAAAGLIVPIWRRQPERVVLTLAVVWNIGHSMLFVGSERLRLQVDPFLILSAAAFLGAVWRLFLVRGDRASSHIPASSAPPVSGL